MINAADIQGHFQARIQDEEDEIIAAWVGKYIRRLEMDLNRIAMAKITEGGYEDVLTFSAKHTGAKEITVTPSDPVAFRKLEFGEFDDQGNLVTPPHSVLKEWRVFIRTN